MKSKHDYNQVLSKGLSSSYWKASSGNAAKPCFEISESQPHVLSADQLQNSQKGTRPVHDGIHSSRRGGYGRMDHK